MNLDNITVNKQSSIRIAGSCIIYFDAFEIQEEAHDADYIFITHEHFDHYDPASIVKVVNENSIVIAPEKMKKKVLKELNIEESRYVFCQPGDVKEFESIKIETVPAYNNIKPFHTKGSKWLGYIVTMDGIRYYISGDTDPNADNKNVSCDVALVPIGGMYTMDKKMAAEFICTIKPQVAIPTHYGEIVGSPADGAEFKKLVEKLDSSIGVDLKL